MRRFVRSAGGWCASLCVATFVAWGCSGDDTNPFTEEPNGGRSGSSSGGSTSGSSMGGSATGGSGAGETGGTSGSSSGGEANGGTTTGGSTGDGGAAADAGADSGGTTTGGTGGTAGSNVGGAGMSGSAGTPMGGAGMSGAGMGGAGTSGAGAGGGGMSGSGGTPGDCKDDDDCDDGYCKKATCDAEWGNCTPVGPDCYGEDAVFDPVCGCDGTTFWNACVLAHTGMNAALHGECTGNNRPTCTRNTGGASCPSGGDHARCYRPMEACSDTSPLNGHCWVVPEECPDDEPQTVRYCGGTAGSARCIGLCEVLEAENTFFRDAPACD